MSIKDALASTGGIEPAFPKGSPIGTVVGGRIASASVRNSFKFGSNEVDTWDDGNPKQQIKVVVQTANLAGQLGPEDNGERAIYIKVWGDQIKALREAIRQAGDDDLHEGGEFYAKITGMRPSSRGNDEILYAYKYSAPVAGTGLDFSQVGGEQVNTQTGEIHAPAQAAPAAAEQAWGAPPAPAAGGWPAQPAAAAPAPAAAPPAAPPAVAQPAPAAAPVATPDPVALVDQLVGLGVPIEGIASTTGLSPEAVAAIINRPRV